MLRHALIWIAALAGSIPAASADEVYLADGRVLEGEVTSPADSAVIDLRAGSGTMVAIQHFERAKVLRVVYGTTARQQRLRELRERQAALGSGGSSDDWWAIAQRAKELGDPVQAKECATQTIARDRQHAEARKALGMVLYNGVWMRPNEIAAARGEVLYQGQWMDWATREALLSEEAKRRDDQAAARKAREDQRRAAYAQAAAEAEAVAPYPETRLGDQGYRLPDTLFYRSIYWPSLAYPTTCGPVRPYYRPTVSLQASGGGGNHAWSFAWNF